MDTRNVMDESVVNTVNMIYEIGKEQYAKYYKDLLNDCTRSIYDPIKKNSQLSSPQTKGKYSENISMLKNDISVCM